jgi:hypothetical protein
MVNTFIIGSFEFTAKNLDKQRRFKQAVESHQIIETIIKKQNGQTNVGFGNHPAVIMWENYLDALKDYYNIVLKYAIEVDKVETKMTYYEVPENVEVPWFCEYKPLIFSHRARLYQKNPSFYENRFDFPEEYLNIGYIWIREDREIYEKAKTIKQIAKLADPLNEKYIDPQYCPAILKSGKRAGEECGRLLNPNNDFCGTHRDKSIPILICEAIKGNGEECKNKAKFGNFCGVHKNYQI